MRSHYFVHQANNLTSVYCKKAGTKTGLPGYWRPAWIPKSATDGEPFVTCKNGGVKRSKDAGSLDAMAAACAEAGKFGRASSVQKEAVSLLNNQKLKPGMTFRLSLYESNLPYHQGDD